MQSPAAWPVGALYLMLQNRLYRGEIVHSRQAIPARLRGSSVRLEASRLVFLPHAAGRHPGARPHGSARAGRARAARARTTALTNRFRRQLLLIGVKRNQTSM